MRRKNLFLGFAVIALAIVVDQISKWWINEHIYADAPLVFGDYFSVIKVWNSGVSFSMFSRHGNVGTVALTVLALVVCAFLLHWMWQETNRCKIVALGMIIGGALGNVIDRLRFGAVLDFLDFHLAQSHWPAFNLADTFICVGACILILMEIFNDRKGLKKE